MDRRYNAVVFDFDFTLADSSAGVAECVNHALGAMGLPAAAPQAIYRTIGLSLTETLKRLAGAEAAA